MRKAIHHSHQRVSFFLRLSSISPLLSPLLFVPCLNKYHHHYLATVSSEKRMTPLSSSWSLTYQEKLYFCNTSFIINVIATTPSRPPLPRLESALLLIFKSALSNLLLTVAYVVSVQFSSVAQSCPTL